MRNLNNSVTLVGNLGKDINFRSFDNGSKVAKASIATNNFYTNKKGEKVQEVDWHTIEGWNKTAELMNQLLQKGSRVMIKGALKNDTYKTKNGESRIFTKVQVQGFQLLTSKSEALPF